MNEKKPEKKPETPNDQRRRKRARLRERVERIHSRNYVEGKSNIDWQKLEFSEFVIFKEYRELPSGEIEEIEEIIKKPVPLISKEAWLANKLADFDARRPEFPHGKYQDSVKIHVEVQQKFFRALRDSSPHIFKNFKNLLPKFCSLFGENGDKYYEIIRKLKIDLAGASIHFPEYSQLNQQYLWGETKLLLNATQFFADPCSDVKRKKRQIPEAIIKARQNVSYEDDLFNRFLDRKTQKYKNLIFKAFEKSAIEKESILSNFLFLQNYLNDWADRYHLTKDWLIEYAYFFLYQMSKDENVRINEIAIYPLIYERLSSEIFEFRFREWYLAEEDVDDYEKRLRREFEKKLSKHLSNTFTSLKLEQRKSFGRPQDFENIKWLIAWNEGATKNQIADFFCKSTETINTRINALEAYNLPILKKTPGRKMSLSEKRLKKIKKVEIG
jgi:hypothetical protein